MRRDYSIGISSGLPDRYPPGRRDHRRQPVRLLAPDRARPDRRPRRGDPGAAQERGRRPLRPPLRAAEVRQDEPAARALADGERQEGLVPVLVDLYGVVSLADVAVRFERAYAKELRGAIRGRIEEFLQKTGLGLSLGRVRDQRAPAAGAEDRSAAGAARAARPAAAARGVRRLPGLHRARRVPGHPQGALAGRPPAQPHPVPGRGRVLRVRRLRAGADEAAVRAQGGAALRLGGAAAARAPARRRSRRATSPSASARASARSARRSTRCSPRRRAIRSARCCWPTGSGKRSSRRARRRSTTGRERTRRRSRSCSRSSRRSGAGSTPRSRRRCARSSPARARPTARRCSSGSR